MAMREVTVEKGEGASSKFFKFTAIGQVIDGKFVSVAKGKYGNEYTFETNDGEKVITAKTDLERKLQKAISSGALVPGVRCAMKYTSDLDVGQESPMKVFKVLVDDVKPQAKQAEDDLPF